jgi:hypothetical protein
MTLIPITVLYDRGGLVRPSDVLWPRLDELYLQIHPGEAQRLGVKPGQPVEIRWADQIARLELELDKSVPAGLAFVPRSMGISIEDPVEVKIIPIGVEER